MIQYLYLGRVPYDEALALQQELATFRLAGRIHNTLLLLEHPPVLTLGRNAQRANVLASDQFLARRGVTLHEINRGGDVTYHGPGQLVGYPIFDLRSLRAPSGNRLGPVDFVRLMEEALIRLCAEHGIPAQRIPKLTGVWCGASTKSERKIAAIGIHVSRGIVTHGFAYNVSTNLEDFRLIVPCGIIDREVTSLEAELRLRAPAASAPVLESAAHQTARIFGAIFGEQILALESLTALRALAQASNPAPQPLRS